MVEISPTRIEKRNHGNSSDDEEEDGTAAAATSQYNRDSSRERLERQESAKKRWKILCIVRTADVQSDETARQEKIQERVDEWMSSFLAKMRIQPDEEKEEQQVGNGVIRMLHKDTYIPRSKKFQSI